MEKQALVEIAKTAAEIVVAYLAAGGAPIPQEGLPAFCEEVAASLAKGANRHITPAPTGPRPAVDPAHSVFDDHIVCLEDGKKLKMLKRHLRKLGLTPEQYRQKWGLKAEYPMVAPAYSKKRAAIAKEMGLNDADRRHRKPIRTLPAASRPSSSFARPEASVAA